VEALREKVDTGFEAMGQVIISTHEDLSHKLVEVKESHMTIQASHQSMTEQASSNYNDILAGMRVTRIEARREAGDLTGYLSCMTKMINDLSKQTGELVTKSALQERMNLRFRHFFANLKIESSVDTKFLENRKSLVTAFVHALKGSGLVPVDPEALEEYYKDLEQMSSRSQRLTINLEEANELPETSLPDAPSHEISPPATPLPPNWKAWNSCRERLLYQKRLGHFLLVSDTVGSPEDHSSAPLTRRLTAALTRVSPGSEEDVFSQAEDVFSEGDQPRNSDDLLPGFRFPSAHSE
jgi:hypothetical protein